MTLNLFRSFTRSLRSSTPLRYSRPRLESMQGPHRGGHPRGERHEQPPRRQHGQAHALSIRPAGRQPRACHTPLRAPARHEGAGLRPGHRRTVRAAPAGARAPQADPPAWHRRRAQLRARGNRGRARSGRRADGEHAALSGRQSTGVVGSSRGAARAGDSDAMRSTPRAQRRRTPSLREAVGRHPRSAPELSGRSGFPGAREDRRPFPGPHASRGLPRGLRTTSM